jgi:hypothetical protein
LLSGFRSISHMPPNTSPPLVNSCRLAAILAADVVGYSRLMGGDGAGAGQLRSVKIVEWFNLFALCPAFLPPAFGKSIACPIAFCPLVMLRRSLRSARNARSAASSANSISSYPGRTPAISHALSRLRPSMIHRSFANDPDGDRVARPIRLDQR